MRTDSICVILLALFCGGCTSWIYSEYAPPTGSEVAKVRVSGRRFTTYGAIEYSPIKFVISKVDGQLTESDYIFKPYPNNVVVTPEPHTLQILAMTGDYINAWTEITYDFDTPGNYLIHVQLAQHNPDWSDYKWDYKIIKE